MFFDHHPAMYQRRPASYYYRQPQHPGYLYYDEAAAEEEAARRALLKRRRLLEQQRHEEERQQQQQQRERLRAHRREQQQQLKQQREQQHQQRQQQRRAQQSDLFEQLFGGGFAAQQRQPQPQPRRRTQFQTEAHNASKQRRLLAQQQQQQQRQTKLAQQAALRRGQLRCVVKIQRWWREVRAAAAEKRADDAAKRIQHWFRARTNARHLNDVLAAMGRVRAIEEQLFALQAEHEQACRALSPTDRRVLGYVDAVEKEMLKTDAIATLGSTAVRQRRKAIVNQAQAMLDTVGDPPLPMDTGSDDGATSSHDESDDGDDAMALL